MYIIQSHTYVYLSHTPVLESLLHTRHHHRDPCGCCRMSHTEDTSASSWGHNGEASILQTKDNHLRNRLLRLLKFVLDVSIVISFELFLNALSHAVGDMV